MAEHLLDATQVCPALQQMSGHRMPQPVRADVRGLRNSTHRFMDDTSGNARIKTPASASKKDSLPR